MRLERQAAGKRLERLVGMTDYKNGGLRFESEASITPGTIVLVGTEERPGNDELRAGALRALACHRVRIQGCTPRKSGGCRYGFDGQHLASPRLGERDGAGCGAAAADKAESEQPSRERRKYVRAPHYRFVYFLCNEKYYEGVTKDISSGGLFVRTRGALKVGMRLYLSIPGNPFEKERTIEAEVVRVETGGIGVKIHRVLKTSQVKP